MKEETNKNLLDANNAPVVDGGIFSNYTKLLQRPINSFDDLYGIEATFTDGSVVKSCPHLVIRNEEDVKVIVYDDSDEMNQSKLIEAMGNRRVLVSVKHHAMEADSDSKEKIKLQCSHAQLVVSSEGKVCTYNNPQNYQGGMFGSPKYPMIFMTPVFPADVSKEDVCEYEKNIILWATLLNSFSEFPGDYNGGDPLSAKSKDEAIEYGNHVLKALMGDEVSIQWIKKPFNHLYCAELVYLSLTLGVIFPLNRSNLSQGVYDNLLKQLSTNDFLSENKNPYIKNIKLELPRDGLIALKDDHAEGDTYFDSSLAVRPMLFSDMITCFIKYNINRGKLGETSGRYQLELLQSIRPMINSMMPGILNTEVNALIDDLEIVLKTEHQSYQEFKSKLTPILGAINGAVAKVSSASNIFVPPHTFLVRALEYEREGRIKGILGMKYLGHGHHKSLI